MIEAPSGQVEHPRQEVTSIDARDETENYHFDINADSPHVMCENGKNGSTFCREIETNEIPTHLLIEASLDSSFVSITLLPNPSVFQSDSNLILTYGFTSAIIPFVRKCIVNFLSM